MTETLLVAAVALGLAAWTLKPLFDGSSTTPKDSGGDPGLDDLVEAKGSVYRTIIDMELDYKMGKLEPKEYELMRNQSKGEALELIRKIDAAGDCAEQPGELTLEQEIEQARARLRKQ
ncbi:MAG: hypothetical protein WD602_10890 [Actinomycetota bacterium]